MKIFMLDMGDEKYGDCIVCITGKKSIIVDAGHAGDIRQRGVTPSIPAQLAKVFGKSAPIPVSLMIVTHCHADHIGCFPDLIGQGIISPEYALVADENLGFGHVPGDDGSDGVTESDNPIIEQVVAAVREEPRSPTDDDTEIAELIADAVSLENRYKTMLEQLQKANTKVFRFGKDKTAPLEKAFSDIGLKIIGPDSDQLMVCAKAIAGLMRETRQRARDALESDAAPQDGVQLYRQITASMSEGQDRPGKGAAINDQSVIVKVGNKKEGVALLTGDMQLSQPEAPGVDDDMKSLRAKVIVEKPYSFVKLAHHASYNGLDESLFDDLGCKAVGMSGGRGDPGHPSAQVLKILRANASKIQWARTDKNGLFSCTIDNGEPKFELTTGELNDATPSKKTSTPKSTKKGSDSVIASQFTGDDEKIEVIARLPHTKTRVTISIDITPGERDDHAEQQQTSSMATGTINSTSSTSTKFEARSKPVADNLLWITNAKGLADNIGQVEAKRALAMIEAVGHTLHDIGGAIGAFNSVAKLANGFNGVVVLGGYDIVPSARIDVLDPQLRAQLGTDTANDADNFVVWSDDPYADLDGDGFAEIPVSRVPDGRSSKLVLNILSRLRNPRPPISSRYGIRNLARPFADKIFARLPGAAAINVSEKYTPADIAPEGLAVPAAYFMLHGSDLDMSRFWGERKNGSPLEAFNAASVPGVCDAVVIAGACWGALTSRTKACDHKDGDPIRTVTPENSIALSFLQAGAPAFIGCTGSHYSPTKGDGYFGGPMHSALWNRLIAGLSPAKALFDAKAEYARGMPHGVNGPLQIAVENKILREFTCLGIGW